MHCQEKKYSKLYTISFFFSVILGQPNYCGYKKPRLIMRIAKRVYVHPYYQAKNGKEKENMPIRDFALIEVRKDMIFSKEGSGSFRDPPKKVQHNGGQLFRLVI